MKELPIIRYSFWYLTVAALLVGASIVLLINPGLRLGIDFTGGTLWRLAPPAEDSLSVESLQGVFQDALKITDAHITRSSDNVYFVRMPVIDEAAHQSYLKELTAAVPGVTELSFETIGPSIGDDLRQNAVRAIVLGLIGISLYIAFAFRKISRPIKSWKYGVVTLLTLFHDVIIAAGFLALAGILWGVEIDANFIVAMLVIAGFSVHDTIVVFDRIREQLLTHKGQLDFKELINNSVNQTLARSINTSLTLILVLVVLLLLGPSTLRFFVAAMLVGTTMGTYSSIFVASPLLYLWEGKPRDGR